VLNGPGEPVHAAAFHVTGVEAQVTVTVTFSVTVTEVFAGACLLKTIPI
jgi:hypothetical protein